jgi:uncharacterized damage-inducible protein DinB
MKAKAQLLVELMDEIWERDSWIDPISPLLVGWSAQKAEKPLHSGIAPVRQIVNHSAFWEETSVRRLMGRSLVDLEKLADQAHGGAAPEEMPRWPQAAENWHSQHLNVTAALAKYDDSQLGCIEKDAGKTLEYMLCGRVIHDAYHAGQISLLRQLIEKSPASALSESAGQDSAESRGKETEFVQGMRELLQTLMGIAWNDDDWVHPMESVLQGLTSRQADRSPADGVHSITAIVNHMAFWEEYGARRLRGESTADMTLVEPGAAPPGIPAWPEASRNLIAQHRAFCEALAGLSDKELAHPRPNASKLFEQRHPAHWIASGVIVHDAYHQGQITLLKQMIGLET